MRVLASIPVAFALLGVAGCGDDVVVEDGEGGSDPAPSGGGGAGGGAGGTGGACDAGEEICDGIDNDCDDAVDEVEGGCACTDGSTQACYSGRPAETRGVGVCTPGSQKCVDGAWGRCEGEVTPEAESCNLADDDCNGLIDDMGTTTCGVGACAVTVDVCEGGERPVCVPGNPSAEVCDGVDNNCNQLTDEIDPQLGLVCDSGQPGVCQAGVYACDVGVLTCVPDATAATETCDGVDNDCNGTPDDNVPGTGGTCSTGLPGVCAPGTISCQNDVIDCFPNTPPSSEVCDGVDNDCDGTPDQGDPEGGGACPTGLPGVCSAGTEHCVASSIECQPNASASPEVCNGVDDNCDGGSDEGNPGGGVACGCSNAGTTACTGGTLQCQGAPPVYFQEDFSDNAAGWTLGTQWAIGAAVAGPVCSGSTGSDPATDHTPTADNGLAGVVIGGCTGTALHADYCMTSPIIDTSSGAGNLILGFYRDLGADYPNFMNTHVDVSSNGGTSWTQIYAHPCCSFINESTWTFQQYNVTAFKTAQFRVRFCYNIAAGGAITAPSWSVDDLTVAGQACP